MKNVRYPEGGFFLTHTVHYMGVTREQLPQSAWYSRYLRA